MTKELRINFDPVHVRRLMPFVAQADLRYWLSGVFVERAEQGGVYLVATDGTALAVAYDKTGTIEGADDAIILISPAMARAAQQACQPKNHPYGYRVMVTGQRAMVAVPDSVFMELFIQGGDCLIDGNYPMWTNVIPHDMSKLRTGGFVDGSRVDANLLARLAKVAGKNSPAVTFWTTGPHDIVLAQLQGIPDLVVGIMPMVADGTMEEQRGLLHPFCKATPAPRRQRELQEPDGAAVSQGQTEGATA